MESATKSLKTHQRAKNSQERNGVSFFELANNLLSDFSPRVQEIIKKRFALEGGKPETLEKIGKDYGITRERVRQIISDTIKKIANRKDDINFRKAQDEIFFAISRNNGIIKEAKAIRDLGYGDIREANSMRFFVGCSQSIKVVEQMDIVELSWMLSENVLKDVEEIARTAKEILKQEKKPISEEKLVEKITAKLPGHHAEKVLNHLEVLIEVKKNKFQKWGMAHWNEINPKGTREKIYLVLREEKKPLHFTKIAELIDKHGLAKKKAHPQTVHNELIKDDRFILVGRGIYALSEWGYKRGTIKDVLQDILERAGKPLTRNEIIDEISKARKVKKATVMINLNNCGLFSKKGESYFLKR